MIRDKVLKKCDKCKEFDMIKICDLKCRSCNEEERKKNKSLLEI